MARKKEPTITVMNIRGATLKGPKLLIQQMSEKTPDLRTTRVIQTFIMENQDLKLGIVKDNKMLYSGVVRWIGNRGNNIDGTVFAVENKDEIKVITPTKSNSGDIEFVPERMQIKINATSTINCGICGRPIEIFDEESVCPHCESSFHKDHIVDYVNKKKECFSCKKALEIKEDSLSIPQ